MKVSNMNIKSMFDDINWTHVTFSIYLLRDIEPYWINASLKDLRVDVLKYMKIVVIKPVTDK